MSEVLTATDKNKFEQLLPSMTALYKREFAKAPWFEVSRCPEPTCATDFTSRLAGDSCAACQTELVEAYDQLELASRWRALLEDGGMAEVELAKGCLHPGYTCTR